MSTFSSSLTCNPFTGSTTAVIDLLWDTVSSVTVATFCQSSVRYMGLGVCARGVCTDWLCNALAKLSG